MTKYRIACLGKGLLSNELLKIPAAAEKYITKRTENTESTDITEITQ
jgi:hypothetical protein